MRMSAQNKTANAINILLQDLTVSLNSQSDVAY